jgi:Bacteriophage T4-like portal protein (Gp20)
LGEIDDLRYFTNKLFRSLRIPSSYLPTGADDSAAVFNDGRVGTAYIQELRFNKYLERLQTLMEKEIDKEFKLYLFQNGITIDDGIFGIGFNPPQNFAAYRLSELDTQRVTTFQAVQEIPYMSKRFAMQRFLGLSQEEIMENERLWREENQDIGGNEEAGITPGGIQDGMAPEEGMEGGDEGAVMAPTVGTPAAGPSGVPAPAGPPA